MTARASRRKSWFLGVVLALAPIAAFGEDVDGQIGQLLEKIRQQDTTSGNLTELIKLVDEAIPLIMRLLLGSGVVGAGLGSASAGPL
jgi:hypothetical protein